MVESNRLGTSLDPSNEMSDSVGWLLLSYLLLVFLLVCSISQLSYREG